MTAKHYILAKFIDDTETKIQTVIATKKDIDKAIDEHRYFTHVGEVFKIKDLVDILRFRGFRKQESGLWLKTARDRMEG